MGELVVVDDDVCTLSLVELELVVLELVVIVAGKVELCAVGPARRIATPASKTRSVSSQQSPSPASQQYVV